MGYMTRAEGAQTTRRVSDGLGVVGVCIWAELEAPAARCVPTTAHRSSRPPPAPVDRRALRCYVPLRSSEWKGCVERRRLAAPGTAELTAPLGMGASQLAWTARLSRAPNLEAVLRCMVGSTMC